MVRQISASVPIDGGAHYSSEEHIVGTFDGKNLYEKVVTVGALVNAGTAEVPHGIAHLDIVVNVCGMAAASGYQIPIPIAGTTSIIGTGQNIAMRVTPTHVQVGTNSNMSAYSAFAIIRYTKTTD